MNYRIPGLALLAGNFLIGISIVGPAGFIEPLATDMNIAVTTAAYLITGGAVVLCLGSPLIAWATSTVDRRLLLTASLVVLCLTHFASAFAPNFTILLLIRLLAMAFAAIFTPQAANAIGMIAEERQRPAAIAFIFLGWSLSAAIGLPAITWLAANLGWRAIHEIAGVVAALSALAVWLTMPAKLRGAPMPLAGFGELLRDRLVMSLIGATALAMTGQFLIVTYFGPILSRLADAQPTGIAIAFAAFGIAGFIGNIAATRMVGRFGPYKTSLYAILAMAIGAAIWAAGVFWLPIVVLGSFVWGSGFAASNSMQQARLGAAAPAMAGTAIALNSSAIYVGQAAGSAVGGAMFDANALAYMGWAATASLVAAVLVIASTRRLAG